MDSFVKIRFEGELQSFHLHVRGYETVYKLTRSVFCLRCVAVDIPDERYFEF